MENYFQAEGFNLDKVLDEFEQNEGELAAESSLANDIGVTFACVSGPSL
jgi:GTP-sensing pleiotropic transcriptional regulator CodY